MLTNAESDEDPQIHILEIAGNALIGGMEKYVHNMAQYLPVHGFKVTCVAPYESVFTSSLRNLGSDVFITPMDHDPPWRSIQLLTELIHYNHIQLIHAHLPKAHVLAGLVGKLANIPVVATVHGMDVTAPELGISRTTGTHLTLVCQGAYSQALALGMPPERVSIIPNGVDLKTFSANRTGASFRKALHIPPTALLVGFVGRLAWEKGPDQFIRMAERVHGQRPEVQFVMIGEGPMGDEIAEMIRKAGLADCIQLAGLWTNTWEVYPAFDVFVQTSRVEGMPFAILESMACGRPTLAMAVGGVAEIIEVGTTGMVSAPGDWAGLGDALIRLLESPERTKQMGQAARKRVEDSFDLQDSVCLMSNLFHRLLGKKVSKESVLQSNWGLPRTAEREVLPIDPNAIFPKRR